MDFEYMRGAAPQLDIAETKVQAMVNQTLKNFAEATTPHVLANSRKFVLYNKLPATVKVMSRPPTVKGVDHSFDAPVIDVVPLHSTSDSFVVLTQDGNATLLDVVELPNQDLKLELQPLGTIAGGARRIVVGQRQGTTHNVYNARSGKVVVGFATDGSTTSIPLVSSADAPSASSSNAAAIITKGASGETGAPSAATAANGLIAVARGTRVRVETVDAAGIDVLAKPWRPHGDEEVQAVHIVKRLHGAGETVPVVTVAAGEIRLWGLQKGRTTQLLQTLAISDAAAAGTPAPVIAVKADSDDDFIFLVQADGTVLAVELAINAQAAPALERVTEWSITEGKKQVVSFAAQYRQVKQTGSDTISEMTAIIRTEEGLRRVVFDNARLRGAPNLVNAASSSSPSAGVTGTPKTATAASIASPAAATMGTPSVTSDSVKKWFATTTPTPSSSSPATAGMPSVVPTSTPTGFTTITSTTGGQTTTKASIDPRAVADAVAEQHDNFGNVLKAVNTAILELEHAANDNLGVLRAQQAQAARAGEESARQMSSTVFANTTAGASTVDSGSSTAINREVLEGFTAAVSEAAAVTVREALSAGLKQHASNAADRSIQLTANAAEKEGLTTMANLPKLTSLPSMQAVQAAIDKAHAQQNDLFKRQKEQDQARLRGVVRTLSDKAQRQNKEAAAYLAELDAAVKGLKADLAGVQALGNGAAGTAAMSAAAPAALPVETEDSVVEAALKLATAGQWQASLLKVTSFGKTSALLRFLESDQVTAARDNIADASSLTVPLFLTLAQQLTTGLGQTVGLIPPRVEWLHAFTLAFDELAEKETTDVRNAAGFLAEIVTAIGQGEMHKSELDRQTRRNMGVVRKALESYAH